MQNLKELIFEAEKEGKAVGHFNIASSEMFWGIVGAAKELNVPVIIGTSEGERKALGGAQSVALVRSTREESDFPIFINADHHHSLESFKEAVDAGYDSAIIDGAALPFEENVAMTKAAVEYARANNPGMLVEGELGYIGTSSKLLDEVPEGAEITEDFLTTPEQAKEFVEKTGVDLFAPAVGNLHGMLKNAANPALDIPRIKAIREAVGVPLVLHGGSGVSDADFRGAIEAGMPIVHISTELRLAYRKALDVSLSANPDEIAPYKYFAPVVEAVKEETKTHMKLFANI